MAKVIWVGEDTDDVPGPSFTTCYGGLKFPKGVPVEVTDEDAIRRARGNLNFKVLEEGKKQQEKSHGAVIGEGQTQDEGQKEQVKVEAKTKDYDYRESEKGSGYSPVKKRVRKKKPAVTAEPAI